MKVVLDSYDLLHAIGSHREAFDAVDDLVRKHAATLLVAQLKHKSTDINRYREIRSAIGAESFELFLDALDDRLLKAIAKRIDPHCPLAKDGEGIELRPHLLQLARGKIEPMAKAKKVTKHAVAKRNVPKAKARKRVEPHAIATKPPRRRNY